MQAGCWRTPPVAAAGCWRRVRLTPACRCAPAPQHALRLADHERQLHALYLANDILFRALAMRAPGSGPDAGARLRPASAAASWWLCWQASC